MKTQDFLSFAEFWPYYLSQHSKKGTRWLHFIGNTNLFFWLTLSALHLSWRLALFSIISSYAIAWIGHFFVERNVPATFRHPIWAGMGDMLMYYKMMRGQINSELEKFQDEIKTIAPKNS